MPRASSVYPCKYISLSLLAPLSLLIPVTRFRFGVTFTLKFASNILPLLLFLAFSPFTSFLSQLFFVMFDAGSLSLFLHMKYVSHVFSPAFPLSLSPRNRIHQSILSCSCDSLFLFSFLTLYLNYLLILMTHSRHSHQIPHSYLCVSVYLFTTRRGRCYF